MLTSQINTLQLVISCVLLSPILSVNAAAQAPPPAVGQPQTGSLQQTTSDKVATASYVNLPVDRKGYVLGTGDRLSIRIFGTDDLPDRPVEIGSDGKVNLPMVGMVQASGISVRKLEADLDTRYSTYFKDPQVSVSVSEYRSQLVTIAGAVNAPNVVQLRGPTRLMEVISQAGGLKTDAGNTVMITRPVSTSKDGNLVRDLNDPDAKFATQQIDLLKIIDGTDPSSNVIVEGNDLITVSKAKMVYVVGDVGRPGGFVLDGHSGSLAVLQAIALAGGINRTASAANARILRAANDDDTHRTESRIDLKKILANRSPDVSLHANDILFVPSSTAKNAGIRALEMAVNVGTGLAIWRF